eukprot:4684855-Prorocentrum_lima.AAC.1
MTSSLVGSEMCIRDREKGVRLPTVAERPMHWICKLVAQRIAYRHGPSSTCLLYTSDAADDM